MLSLFIKFEVLDNLDVFIFALNSLLSVKGLHIDTISIDVAQFSVKALCLLRLSEFFFSQNLAWIIYGSDSLKFQIKGFLKSILRMLEKSLKLSIKLLLHSLYIFDGQS
jgi:hypothetical protein